MNRVEAWGPVFAVLDPDRPTARAWREAGCGDVAELASPRIGFVGGRPVVRVKVSSLPWAGFLRLCRAFARRTPGMTEALALVDALHGAGLPIPAAQCFVCSDPDQGRAFFAARKGGGRRG